MKDFSEFWTTISQDEVAAMVDNITPVLEKLKESEDKSTVLGNSIAAISLHLNRQLLERYHKWLCEQLEQPTKD